MTDYNVYVVIPNPLGLNDDEEEKIACLEAENIEQAIDKLIWIYNQHCKNHRSNKVPENKREKLLTFVFKPMIYKQEYFWHRKADEYVFVPYENIDPKSWHIQNLNLECRTSDNNELYDGSLNGLQRRIEQEKSGYEGIKRYVGRS